MSELLSNQDYTLLISIVKESHASKVIKAAQLEGAHGATILLGKGVLSQAQASLFGKPFETGRQIIFLAVRNDRKKKIMQRIYDQSGLKTEAHGLVFELPLIAAAGIAPINLSDSGTDTLGG